ncbi:CheR family methyltransferase [Imhoffiella purpurea]|uniref:Chemotaxis protein methyltransferase n=1 Tax=Imhoffiella purpurea TaxID=1249627 RepID=W9VLA3_9GAMM|nr:protein-glutamate O-methyltransferase CheR [Imhoffiella purpurea]EXJ16847.1 Chemotaxis protein methyltransferase CheR [Imhoffiella purpurea]
MSILDPAVPPHSALAVSDAGTEVVSLTDEDFDAFRRFIYDAAGISLAPHKRQMVNARLQKRLRQLKMRSFEQYLSHALASDQSLERQHLVDLLTTNETYFYREPAHFDYLSDQILPAFRGRSFRAWSAACSSGEEVYTLAMLLAEGLGMGDWQILGSDISQRMIEQARRGLYPLERAKRLPNAWLTKYCLKGVRSQAGNLLIDPRLSKRVQFEMHNLKQGFSDQRQFDLVLLRNVLIYFDQPTKQLVLDGVVRCLRPGGHLIISHVESLHGLVSGLRMVRPSIFRHLPT